MSEDAGRTRRIWALLAVNLVALAAVGWLTWHQSRIPAGTVHFVSVAYSGLPDWQSSDERPALAAFGRSCSVIAKLPKTHALGGLGYAGVAGDWAAVCASIPKDAATAAQSRAYFERWFSPFTVTSAREPLFTGYYEPTLSGSRTRTAQYRVPIYGRPTDLVAADLGLFRRASTGGRIYGRLAGHELVPYATRADIDGSGLSTASVLLYTDNAIDAFFLAIQGSGRVRFSDGTTQRLSFAATNGRRYTSIGHVLVEQGALDRKSASMQAIRAWLQAHAREAQKVMEEDESFVFFSLEPLGDALLGSAGTEGAPLTAEASVAVDSRYHPFGVPIYVATTASNGASPAAEQAYDKLLIAQDTGGDIHGAARFDIFFGAGGRAEEIAGHLKSNGRFFVLLPKALAARIAESKEYSDEVP